MNERRVTETHPVPPFAVKHGGKLAMPTEPPQPPLDLGAGVASPAPGNFPGSVWLHHSGREYTVLMLTNTGGDNPVKFPITVVYRDSKGAIWSWPMSDWYRRMTFTGKWKRADGLTYTSPEPEPKPAMEARRQPKLPLFDPVAVLIQRATELIDGQFGDDRVTYGVLDQLSLLVENLSGAVDSLNSTFNYMVGDPVYSPGGVPLGTVVSHFVIGDPMTPVIMYAVEYDGTVTCYNESEMRA